MVDERLTSVAAERALLAGGASRARRRQLSDQVAATLILQSYLDTPGERR
jgi:putative Holliday junction resolvase